MSVVTVEAVEGDVSSTISWMTTAAAWVTTRHPARTSTRSAASRAAGRCDRAPASPARPRRRRRPSTTRSAFAPPAPPSSSGRFASPAGRRCRSTGAPRRPSPVEAQRPTEAAPPRWSGVGPARRRRGQVLDPRSPASAASTPTYDSSSTRYATTSEILGVLGYFSAVFAEPHLLELCKCC